MGEMPISISLDSKVKAGLEEEARLQHRAVSDVAERAIKTYLDHQALKREAIERAVAEADKGVFISSEAMDAWMERLEDDPNAPAPEPDVFLTPRR